MARVLKTQGRHGEIAVELHTDIPGRIRPQMRLWALAPNGGRRELRVERIWPHKQHLVMKFAGIDSISDGEALIGCELQVPRDERAQLEPGWAYVSDLTGCAVFDGERRIGVIAEVRFGAGEAPLLVVKGEQEYEIPYAEAYLTSVDVAGKKIGMSLPQGMLEVNAPLSAEEKQGQRRRGAKSS